MQQHENPSPDMLNCEQIIQSPIIEDVLGIMNTATIKNLVGRDTDPKFLQHITRILIATRFNEVSFTQRRATQHGIVYVQKRFFNNGTVAISPKGHVPGSDNIRNVFGEEECEKTKYGYKVSKIPTPGIGEDFSVLLSDDIVISGDKYHKAEDVSLAIGVIETLVTFLDTIIKKELLASNLSLDELTGVYNKRKWMYDNFTSGHLLIADIDNFKDVNDKYGHDVGDVVLKTVSGALQSLVRETDSIYRFGGEEFCIVLEEERPKIVGMVSERIREKVGELDIMIPRRFKSDRLRKTISIGVSNILGHTKDEAFETADKNLYVSKRGGRNRVTYPTPEYA